MVANLHHAIIRCVARIIGVLLVPSALVSSSVPACRCLLLVHEETVIGTIHAEDSLQSVCTVATIPTTVAKYLWSSMLQKCLASRVRFCED